MSALARARGWLSGSSVRESYLRRIVAGLSPTLRIAGIVLLVVGLQAWGFNRQVISRTDVAAANLALLQQEVPGNRLINAAMTSLRDYYRISNDELRRRQIVELRDTVSERFAENPRLAIDDAVRITGGFDARTSGEHEAINSVIQNFARLQEIYADHYAAAIEAYSDPSWLFQPAAALLRMRSSAGLALRFDHALYLMLVGDRAAANAILESLREADGSAAFDSRVLLAQARLQFDAFRVEQDPEYLRQAVEYARESLRHDAAYELPKLLLEYLLAIEPQAAETGETSMQGQGTGESEGERGSISDRPSEF